MSISAESLMARFEDVCNVFVGSRKDTTAVQLSWDEERLLLRPWTISINGLIFKISLEADLILD